jgi:purine-cytosine permease-like protein
VDPKPDVEVRIHPMLISWSQIFLLWWSLNVHVGVIPLGILGPEFGLSLKQSVAASIVGTVLGALCTSFTGTLGPKLGLRQIATSRYSFGFWGAKLCSVLNVLIGGGFSVVNYVSPLLIPSVNPLTDILL